MLIVIVEKGWLFFDYVVKGFVELLEDVYVFDVVWLWCIDCS